MRQFPPFQHYPEKIRRWVAARNWPGFTAIQQAALQVIPIDRAQPLGDFILAAETSSGKTEAAFLPLFARSLGRPREAQKRFSLLYISPLRALINDQYGRLAELGKQLDLPVFRWHSDVPGREKDAALAAGRGVLLTTPESMEAFFLRHSREGIALNRLAQLEAVVIDELHAFFEGARGRHLQSLLHRLEARAKRSLPRLGLSATLGDVGAAAGEVLRPKAKTPPTILSTEAEARNVSISLKIFLDHAKPVVGKKHNEPKQGESVYDRLAEAVRADFGSVERGLIFCNSRARVETVFERLTFKPVKGEAIYGRHHSSIEPKLRLQLEKDMRGDGENPPQKLVAICTNSLELGIDIGRAEKVGQIESTYSVAALRQRIGRSGRRAGMPITGVIYSVEKALDDFSHPLDALRLRTFQAAATLMLALDGRFERPSLSDLHLSTLVHQVVSLARQEKSIDVTAAWQLLVRDGPWDSEVITEKFFARFLETLTEGKKPFLARDETRWTLADLNRRPTYAVFSTPPEYAVVFAGRTIGQLPMTSPYRAGDTFVLAGARWKVRSVSDEFHRIIVTRASNAGAPRYGGSVQAPSELVVRRMLALYTSTAKIPGLANPAAKTCIDEGRAAFNRFGLDRNRLLKVDRDTILFPWRGDRKAQTLVLVLRREGLRAGTSSFAVTVEGATPADVRTALKAAKRQGLGELDELAREARQLASDRFDYALIPYHQRLAYARRFLEADGFDDLLRELVAAPDVDAAATPVTAKVASKR